MENDKDIIFEKKISIDNQYLFTVEQTITNKSDNTYNFYPYGQIIRNKAPEVTGFYILHEGLIGVFDDQLVEEDYKDIRKKNSSFNSQNGFLELQINTLLQQLYLTLTKNLDQILILKKDLEQVLFIINLLK